MKRSPTPRSRWRVAKKASSQRWLARQAKDPYAAGAKRRRYASRAAYKLLEIDKKFRLLKSAKTVLDLGAAPGGWSEVAAGCGLSVLAVDIRPFTPPAGVVFLRGDIRAKTLSVAIAAALDKKADLVLCDCAADFIGNRVADRVRNEELSLDATNLTVKLLAQNGNFLVKIFGGASVQLLELIDENFASRHYCKPPSSRKDSAENYLLATGFFGHKPL